MINNQVKLAKVLSEDLAKAAFEKMSQSAPMLNSNETIVGNFCLPTPPIAVQQHYSQIHNKMISIKEKLANELAQSNFRLKNLAASVFTTSETAGAMGITKI